MTDRKCEREDPSPSVDVAHWQSDPNPCMNIRSYTSRWVRLVIARGRNRSSRSFLLQLLPNRRHQPFRTLARVSQSPQSRIIQARRIPDVRKRKQI